MEAEEPDSGNTLSLEVQNMERDVLKTMQRLKMWRNHGLGCLGLVNRVHLPNCLELVREEK